MFMCVFGFFHHFSVEETNHFSKMVAVCVCPFYLLVARILTTTLDNSSTTNSLFVRPPFFWCLLLNLLSMWQITCSLAGSFHTLFVSVWLTL